MAAVWDLSGEEETSTQGASAWRAHSWSDWFRAALATREGRTAALLALTLASILVHGYHMGTDDAAIYAPGIKKAADPSLYPFGSEFFMHHAGLSLFPHLVAAVSWLAHMPIEWSMLLWFALAQFLLLWGGYELARQCFRSERARWAGVGLLAATLNVPVAGTALILADSYLTARSLSTPLVLLSVICFLGGRNRAGCFWLVISFLIHPQMAMYGVGFGILAAFDARSQERVRLAEAAPVLPALLFPFLVHLQPAQGAYREVLTSRAYFDVTTWHWYEWLGAIAPLLILAVLARLSLKSILPPFSRVARILVALGLISIVAACVLASDPDFGYLLRLQPMRSFHLLYVVFFVLLGGLLGEYLLRGRVWRWLLCFGALSSAMFALDLAAYPASPHIERPGARYSGEWLSSFLWIRDHTPKDAVFALDADYLSKPGVDLHGFRAVAERSMLADEEKDSGAASVFPELSEDWKEQSEAQSDWQHVSENRLHNLRDRYGVTWVLMENPAPLADLVCPYRNGDLRVCQIVDDRRQLLSGPDGPENRNAAAHARTPIKNPVAGKVRPSSHRIVAQLQLSHPVILRKWGP
ncbi:MAG TPA: hypothetical protein VHS34_11370 [Terriglobales bacterium]|jgi:hypothetical protein|nr:hypothetical protein [Terriglobales bacterium]